MGLLRDITDLIRDLKDSPDILANLKKNGVTGKSISKLSKEGIHQFPCIVTTANDFEPTTSAVKACEKNYASFLQVVYSMNSVMAAEDGKGAADYLRRFHQNAEGKTDLGDVISTFATESYEALETNNVLCEAIICDGSSASIVIENRDQLEEELNSFVTDIVNDKYRPGAHLNSVMQEASLWDRGSWADFSKARNNTSKAGLWDFMEEETKGTDTKTEKNISPKSNSTNHNNINRRSTTSYSNSRQPERRNGRNNTNNTFAAQLSPNDVKKSNELVPTTLILKLSLQDKNGNISGTTELVIGVKCVIHPVKSEEMIANLSNINRGKLFNFIRWTSGEISFFKDFLFNIGEIKTDVVNRSKGASRWWITLKRRADLARVGKRLFSNKSILPNATIICSMNEVEFLKANKNIDLLDQFYIDKIMKQFFLLGFVIIDESAQLMYFMFDGNSDWEVLSFTAVERENSSKSNDFKEMLKLINRY